MILVQRLVHDRNLALAEGVVKRIVDVGGSHSQPDAVSRSMITVASRPLSCWSVLTSRRSGKRAQLLQQKRRPMIQVIKILALQGVLILRLALAAADGKVLRGLHKQGCPWHHRQLAAQPADNLVGADLPFGRAASG